MARAERPVFPGEDRAARRLWLLGLLMAVPFVLFALRYPLPGRTNLTDMGYLSGYAWPEFALYVGGMLALFVLYGLALRETRRLPARRALPVVLGWGTALSALLFWMYPTTAIDVFVYVIRSRILSTYGDNPLAHLALEYEHDPLIRALRGEWSYHPSPYGPLWNLIAAPITYLTDDDLALGAMAFKLLAILCLLGSAWVVGRTLLRTRPEDAATGTLLLLWNPLALWEVAGNGHNDAVMVLPMALAFAAWARRKDAWVLPLLGIAALVKVTAVLLLPVALVAVWRRASGGERLGLALRTGAVGAVVLAVAFFPFYDVGAVLRSVRDTSQIFVVSPSTMVVHALQDAVPREVIRGWLKTAGLAVLGATLLAACIAAWRPERLARACFEVFFVFLVAVTTYFQGWYLLWPLALAALLPWGWPAWRMVAWTAGAMASYAVFIWVRAWWIPGGPEILRLAMPVIAGPVVLLTLVEVFTLLRSRRRVQTAPPPGGTKGRSAPLPGVRIGR